MLFYGMSFAIALYLSMKKIIPFAAALILIACNNVTSNTDKEILDSFNTVDTRLQDTTPIQIDSSNTGVGAITSVPSSNKDTIASYPSKSVEKWRKKTAARPKAKIDSTAIREANKLPLDQ
ncbi:MAG: hypothetical protein JWP69_2041 [Flaviaesturariibacter sp.]|nr:hypothetical protein [Flaviaesturariibacter sp.]